MLPGSDVLEIIVKKNVSASWLRLLLTTLTIDASLFWCLLAFFFKIYKRW